MYKGGKAGQVHTSLSDAIILKSPPPFIYLARAGGVSHTGRTALLGRGVGGQEVWVHKIPHQGLRGAGDTQGAVGVLRLQAVAYTNLTPPTNREV